MLYIYSLAILFIGGLKAWQGQLAIGAYSFLVFIKTRMRPWILMPGWRTKDLRVYSKVWSTFNETLIKTLNKKNSQTACTADELTVISF